jgi:hypothetical protein
LWRWPGAISQVFGIINQSGVEGVIAQPARCVERTIVSDIYNGRPIRLDADRYLIEATEDMPLLHAIGLLDPQVDLGGYVEETSPHKGLG